jgi:hypothetical protein
MGLFMLMARSCCAIVYCTLEASEQVDAAVSISICIPSQDQLAHLEDAVS